QAQRKPEVILHYNRNKGGVDTVDQMTAEYSCNRKNNRWPMKTFHGMVDIVCSNAYIMWIEKYPKWCEDKKSRRQLFLEELAEEMITPLIKRRNWSGLQKPIKTAMTLFGATPPAEKEPSRDKGRGFCYLCAHKKRIRGKCEVCDLSVCSDHSQNVCDICVGATSKD
ncbi:unnamed protein product, partial [Allacma fusca]